MVWFSWLTATYIALGDMAASSCHMLLLRTRVLPLLPGVQRGLLAEPA